jgi:hypothetical protein
VTLTRTNFFLKAAIMPVTIEHSNQSSDDSGGEARLPISESAQIPGWMSARRERTTEGLDLLDKPPTLPAVPANRSKIAIAAPNTTVASSVDASTKQGWFNDWTTPQGMIGIVVSLFLHAIVMLILACLIMSQASTPELTTIWGMQGNSDELSADITMDSEAVSEGGESAPVEVTQASQTLDSLAIQGDLAESMRIGLGGKGNGEGATGEGTGLDGGVGAAAMKIPGHAQTKGSFSAWADPRDPKPGENYDIVIQIKLPGNITKIRGSDITGNVIGTDSYRQTIRFKPNELLPIEGGMARIRIPVPGAARLVRDTIRVESKLLREKQIFEIEF